jgi:hypothetical protein
MINIEEKIPVRNVLIKVSVHFFYVGYVSVCLRISATIACSIVHMLDQFFRLPLEHFASLSTTIVSFMCL